MPVAATVDEPVLVPFGALDALLVLELVLGDELDQQPSISTHASVHLIAR